MGDKTFEYMYFLFSTVTLYLLITTIKQQILTYLKLLSLFLNKTYICSTVNTMFSVIGIYFAKNSFEKVTKSLNIFS